MSKFFESFKSHSKGEYGTGKKVASNKQLMVGAHQRQAEALEKIADNLVGIFAVLLIGGAIGILALFIAYR